MSRTHPTLPVGGIRNGCGDRAASRTVTHLYSPALACRTPCINRARARSHINRALALARAAQQPRAAHCWGEGRLLSAVGRATLQTAVANPASAREGGRLLSEQVVQPVQHPLDSRRRRAMLGELATPAHAPQTHTLVSSVARGFAFTSGPSTKAANSSCSAPPPPGGGAAGEVQHGSKDRRVLEGVQGVCVCSGWWITSSRSSSDSTVAAWLAAKSCTPTKRRPGQTSPCRRIPGTMLLQAATACLCLCCTSAVCSCCAPAGANRRHGKHGYARGGRTVESVEPGGGHEPVHF